MAHLFYFDESVDDQFFVLAAVVMQEADWLKNIDAALDLRRRARKSLGIPTSGELKAANIRHSSGAIAHLKWDTERRADLFNKLLAWQRKHLAVRVFAIAIAKKKLMPGKDPREFAWKFMIERVDTYCRKENTVALMFPDAGHGYFIRRLVRKMRRFAPTPGRYGGTLTRPCERIVEDPSDRLSHESLFIQLADWNAFAALRSHYVAPTIASFATAWDCLGDARVQVEKLTVPPHLPGIKLFPK